MSFASPLTQPQTYRNLLYLLLALPLGLAHFVFLTIGIALGLALLITWLGLAVLLATLGGAFVLASVERELAARLLGRQSHPQKQHAPTRARGIPARLLAHARSRDTWAALAYLALKLPLGLATFAVTATALVAAGVLLTAPLTYAATDLDVAGWSVDTLGEAVTASALGLLALPLALHALNAVAALWRRVNALLLAR